MHCPKCHAVVKDKARRCRVCGTRFRERCPRCGAPTLPTMEFCAACGTLLTVARAPQRRFARTARRVARAAGQVVLVLLVVLVVAGVGMALLSRLETPPEVTGPWLATRLETLQANARSFDPEVAFHKLQSDVDGVIGGIISGLSGIGEGIRAMFGRWTRY